jgi:hypothetical protein
MPPVALDRNSSEGEEGGNRLGRRTLCAHPAPLLKALAAIHGTSLRWSERNGCLLAALRADRLSFHALHSSGGGRAVGSLHAVRLTRLAPLGFVLEALVGEKHLFAGREYKFGSTFGALQDLVMIFHTLLRLRLRTGEAAAQPRANRAPCIRLDLRMSLACSPEAVWNDPTDALA